VYSIFFLGMQDLSPTCVTIGGGRHDFVLEPRMLLEVKSKAGSIQEGELQNVPTDYGTRTTN